MGDKDDNDEPTPRPTIFGSFIDFVRKDSLSRDDSPKKNSHLLTWSNGIRQLVSKKKRRHREDGFDLDLTYITPRLIAMGFPSSGNEGIYRNNAVHVTEFLGNKHGDKVKVYNLCSERDYPKELFGGRVSKYPFDDHNPPPMAMFLPYCKDVCQWFDANPQNVAAIHCKAGKGRTGVMICAYLIYAGEWENPHDCMQFYGFARTNNQKGVTIPSQRRFITYFAELCRSGTCPLKSSGSTASTSSTTATTTTATTAVESPTSSDVSIMKKGSTSFQEVLGVEDEDENENEEPKVPLKGSDKPRRQKSLIGVDLKVLKEEMEIVKDDLASGDENETDSEEEKNEKKSSTLSRSATGDSHHEHNNNMNDEDDASRPIVHTSKGDFKDYTDEGTLNLKLKRASLQAAVTATAPRSGYAQSSLWMTSFHQEVEDILTDSGIEIPYNNPMAYLTNRLETMKLIENVKDIQSSTTSNGWTDTTREKGEVYRPVPLSIVEIRLSAAPKLSLRGTFEPYFTIKSAGTTISSSDFLPRHTYRTDGPITLAVPGVVVIDEFLITLYDRSSMTGGKTKLGQFWLHTGFIKDHHVVLTKPEIDKIHKDKKHKKFPADFTIEVLFDEATFELEEYIHEGVGGTVGSI